MSRVPAIDAAAVRPAELPKPKAVDPQKLKVAREFEAVFLRKMLASVEKSGHVAGGDSKVTGGDIYSSMVVGALSDAVASAGGIGLARVLVEAMGPAATQAAPGKMTGTSQNSDGAPKERAPIAVQRGAGHK